MFFLGSVDYQHTPSLNGVEEIKPVCCALNLLSLPRRCSFASAISQKSEFSKVCPAVVSSRDRLKFSVLEDGIEVDRI